MIIIQIQASLNFVHNGVMQGLRNEKPTHNTLGKHQSHLFSFRYIKINIFIQNKGEHIQVDVYPYCVMGQLVDL